MSEIEHHFKRLPAEWEPQIAVLLTWPHKQGAWGVDYSDAEKAFIAIAKGIAATQNVIIGAENPEHQTTILNKLNQQHANMERILTYLTPSNDVWARDHGPITVFENNIPTLYDFRFDGWGNKYEATLDDQISLHLFEAQLLKNYQFTKVDFILEGGSIETDGQGTLLTTSQCVQLSRHQALSKEMLEAKFQEYFGSSRVLWIDNVSLLGDDTDGHIDTLARFINPHTIAYVYCEDKNDPNYAALDNMLQTLKTFKDPSNQPYHLVGLPLPRPIFNKEKKRLPATYANFLITNESVLVPVYQDDQDTSVLNIFKKYYPEKNIIGIDCRAIIEQYGSLHCLTMQIPAPSLVSRK